MDGAAASPQETLLDQDEKASKCAVPLIPAGLADAPTQPGSPVPLIESKPAAPATPGAEPLTQVVPQPAHTQPAHPEPLKPEMQAAMAQPATPAEAQPEPVMQPAATQAQVQPEPVVQAAMAPATPAQVQPEPVVPATQPAATQAQVQPQPVAQAATQPAATQAQVQPEPVVQAATQPAATPAEPVAQAQPGATPAQGHEPVVQAQPAATPAQGHEPVVQAQPAATPAQGHEPVVQAQPAATPAQGHEPVVQAQPAAAPAQGHEPVVQALAQPAATPLQPESTSPATPSATPSAEKAPVEQAAKTVEKKQDFGNLAVPQRPAEPAQDRTLELAGLQALMEQQKAREQSAGSQMPPVQLETPQVTINWSSHRKEGMRLKRLMEESPDAAKYPHMVDMWNKGSAESWSRFLRFFDYFQISFSKGCRFLYGSFS